jgi:hypothetical protein
MSIDVMKQALEALEWCFRETGFVDPDNVMQSLRLAIKQAEKQEPVIGTKTWHENGQVITQNLYPSDVYKQEKQEPVAMGWMRRDGTLHKGCPLVGEPEGWTPLYTAPPQREWAGLTDEEFSDCLVEGDPCEALAEPEAWTVMREVEAKLREKNAAPPQRQPLTWEQVNDELWLKACNDHTKLPTHVVFARLIERAHGIGGGE